MIFLYKFIEVIKKLKFKFKNLNFSPNSKFNMTTLKFDDIYDTVHIQVDYTDHRGHQVSKVCERNVVITLTDDDSTGKSPMVPSVTSITIFDDNVKELAAYLRRVADMLDPPQNVQSSEYSDD